MLALIAAHAIAGPPGPTPVVVEEVDEHDALRRAAWATGRDEASLSLVPAGALLAPGLRVEGAATLEPCVGPASEAAQLRYLLERIDGALGWGDLVAAEALLGEATAVIRCLDTPPPPAEVALWQALSGVVLGGDDPAVGAHWLSLARRTDPAVPIDPSWPVDPALRTSAPPDRSARLTVLSAAAVHVDGAPLERFADVELAAGTHLLTVRGTGHLLALDGDAWLIDVGPGDLPALDAPDHRPLASGLLASRFGEGTATLVVTRGAVWSAPAGRGDWVQIERSRTSPWVATGGGLTAAGIAAAALGTTFALGQVGAARAASGAQSAAGSTAAFDRATREYETAAAAIRTWRGVGIGGAVVGGIGAACFTVGLANGRVSSRPAPPEEP